MTIELTGPYINFNVPTTEVHPEDGSTPVYKTILVFHNGSGSQIDDLHVYTSPTETKTEKVPLTGLSRTIYEAPKLKSIRVVQVGDKGEEGGELKSTPPPNIDGNGTHNVDLKFSQKIDHCTRFKIEISFDSPWSSAHGVTSFVVLPTLGGVVVVGDDGGQPGGGSPPKLGK